MADNKRSVCFCTLPLSSFGGAERLIAEEMSFFADCGYDVHIIASEYSNELFEKYPFPDDIVCHFFEPNEGKLPMSYLVSQARSYRQLFKKYDFDVVIAHYTIREVGLAIASLPGYDPWAGCHIHGTFLWFSDQFKRLAHRTKPCFKDLIAAVSGHNEFCEEDGEDFNRRRRMKWRFYEALYQRVLPLYDRVSVNTERVQKEVECLYRYEPKIDRPGISQSWIDQVDSVEPRPLLDTDHTVLSISRLDERKRLDLLIKAISRIHASECYDVGLCIVGEGEERSYLEKLTRCEGITDIVRFMGRVDEDELPQVYKTADVFACPGWMSYGIAPLEAYAFSMPVAISSDAFAHEVIGDAPGVEIIQSDVEAWSEKLPNLFDIDPNYNTTILPTWEEFTQKKYGMINGV